jgi:hypothetical protein
MTERKPRKANATKPTKMVPVAAAFTEEEFVKVVELADRKSIPIRTVLRQIIREHFKMEAI